MGSGKGNMELVRENREVRCDAWTHWAAQQVEAEEKAITKSVCKEKGTEGHERKRPVFSPSLLKGWCHLTENVVDFAVDFFLRTSTSCMWDKVRFLIVPSSALFLHFSTMSHLKSQEILRSNFWSLWPVLWSDKVMPALIGASRQGRFVLFGAVHETVITPSFTLYKLSICLLLSPSADMLASKLICGLFIQIIEDHTENSSIYFWMYTKYLYLRPTLHLVDLDHLDWAITSGWETYLLFSGKILSIF